MAATALKTFVAAMPLLFALGFLAPVFAQGMETLAIDAPFGMARQSFSIALAALWGLVATITGRWI